MSVPESSRVITSLEAIGAKATEVAATQIHYDPNASELPSSPGFAVGFDTWGASFGSSDAAGAAGLNSRDQGGISIRFSLGVEKGGDYQFFITGDDQSAFYLSTDADPANSQEILRQEAWSSYRFNPSSGSASVPLDADKLYWVNLDYFGTGDPNYVRGGAWNGTDFVNVAQLGDIGAGGNTETSNRSFRRVHGRNAVEFNIFSIEGDLSGNNSVNRGEPIKVDVYGNTDPAVPNHFEFYANVEVGSSASLIQGSEALTHAINGSDDNLSREITVLDSASGQVLASHGLELNFDTWSGAALPVQVGDTQAKFQLTVRVNPNSEFSEALNNSPGGSFEMHTDQGGVYPLTIIDVPRSDQKVLQTDLLLSPDPQESSEVRVTVTPSGGDGSLSKTLKFGASASQGKKAASIGRMGLSEDGGFSETLKLNVAATQGMKVAFIGGTGPDQQAAVVPGNFRGDFDLQSGGNQVWGNRDEATFVYETVEGNFDKKVKVEHYEASSPWARLGLNVRKTTDPNSANVLVMMSPSHTADGNLGGDDNQMYGRQTDGGPTIQPYFIPGLGRPWVRLMRRGDEFWGFAARDGVSWVEIGHIQIPNAPATMCVGPIFSPDRNNAPEGYKTTSFWASYRDYGNTFANLTLGSDSFGGVRSGQPYKIHASRLLRNDIHGEGGFLFVTDVKDPSPPGATVRLEGDWVIFQYPPGGGTVGSFRYRASDGRGAKEWASVTLNSGDSSTIPSGDQSGIRLLGNGCVRVSFDGIPGRTYTIQFATEVPSSNWQKIGTAVANDEGIYEFEHCPGGAGAAYYRSVYP